MNKMKINQRKIAELAGVSCATVSRALTTGSVSEGVRARIEAAMNSLGYASHADGVSPDRMILVVVGDAAESFFAHIVRGICDRLQENGCFAVLCNSRFDGAVETQYIRMAEAGRFAGIILITAEESPELVALIRSLTVPLVFVNRYIRALSMDEVCVDNHQGAYIATQHMLSMGHRRIAHLAGPTTSSATKDRLDGYRSAMRDAGLDAPDSFVFRGDLSPRSGYHLAKQIADPANRFSAVFCANAQMAFGMMNRFTEMGVEIPNDLSVVCHDELPHVIEGPYRLTTVSFDPYPLGIEAVNALTRRIQDPAADRIRIFYTPRLVERTSVRAL